MDNIKQFVDQAFEEKRNEVSKHCVKAYLVEESTELTGSRVGGNPYVPEGHEVPLMEDGSQLNFIMQINFKDVPALENYPTKGIVQWWIGRDDVMGMEWTDDPDVMILQRRFRVVFFPEELPPRPFESLEYKTDPEYTPVYRECSVKFAKTATLDPWAYEYYDFMNPLLDRVVELVKGDGKGDESEESEKDEEIRIEAQTYYENELIPREKKRIFFDLPEENKEKFLESHTQIGGSAYFTQDDPRSGEKNVLASEILMQLDTDGDLCMWGDAGIGQIFITKDALASMVKGEVDAVEGPGKVMYNWDCC